MMTRRERLMATLRGEPVDRPAVSFYEIGGWKLDPDDADPFNIYNSSDWRPLLRLAEEETDLIRMLGPQRKPAADNRWDEFFSVDTYLENGSRYTRQTLTVAGRTMTSLSRRDPEVSTTWTLEHLLKDIDDVQAYLQLPDEVWAQEYSVEPLLAEEAALGEAGIVMVDVGARADRAPVVSPTAGKARPGHLSDGGRGFEAVSGALVAGGRLRVRV
jgi:hypothetical protein